MPDAPLNEAAIDETRGRAASPARRMPRLGPLQRRLFVIVFVGLLPLALLAFGTLLFTANAQRAQVFEATENTVRANVTAVDTEIANSWTALDALAASPRLASEDWHAFHAELSQFLQRRPEWANIVLSTPAAQQVVNARVPFGQPLGSRVDPQTLEAVAAQRAPQVGGLRRAPRTGELVFAASVPVVRDGKVAWVLTAPVRPEAIRRVIARQQIPEQGVVAVLDKDHRVLARSDQQEAFIGQPATADLRALIDANPEGGRGVTTTLHGQSVYAFYRRSPLTGWIIAVGIPKAVIDAPVLRSYAVLGGGIVVSMALGLIAAFFTALSVTRPMRELERAAAAVGAGRAPPPPSTDLPEVREAAAALAAAHVEREKLLGAERDARLAAEAASRAKDQFLALLGHELRNPIAAISAASQIIDRVQPGSAYANEANAIIRRQTLHLGRLTDDLLDAGRVVLGKIALKREPVDLGRVAHRTVQTMRETGRLADRDVSVSAGTAWVDADPTRLEQIVGNLVGNAVKFSREGQPIDVEVEAGDGVAVLRVRDRGIGIEPELLPRLFELFVQGRQSPDRSEGGLGVGLALVRRLAQLHGGTAHAHSEGPGRGSEFVVRLPLAAPPAEHPAAPQVRPRPMRIVLVEDNEDARAMLRRALELDGHEVVEAADGRSGAEAILRTQPDAAIVDIGLPGQDGYAVAREVRARQARPVRLIALTGYGQPADAERGREAGFDAYLVKPASHDALSAALQG